MTDPKKMIQREPTTQVGLDELRQRIAAGARADHHKSTQEMLDADDIRTQVAAGVVDGMALVMSDAELLKRFAHTLYEELTERGSTQASQWFIKRAFTAVVLAVVTAGMLYLLRNGALK